MWVILDMVFLSQPEGYHFDEKVTGKYKPILIYGFWNEVVCSDLSILILVTSISKNESIQIEVVVSQPIMEKWSVMGIWYELLFVQMR